MKDNYFYFKNSLTCSFSRPRTPEIEDQDDFLTLTPDVNDLFEDEIVEESSERSQTISASTTRQPDGMGEEPSLNLAMGESAEPSSILMETQVWL